MRNPLNVYKAKNMIWNLTNADSDDCCENIIPIKGDPSRWKECFCPQACDERQFNVIMTSSSIDDDVSKIIVDAEYLSLYSFYGS